MPPRRPPDKKAAAPGNQGATAKSTGRTTTPTLPPVTPVTDNLGVQISRGSAGDCCLLCGKVRVDFPVEHGCIPNLPADQLAEVLTVRPRRSWDEMLDGAR
jgi:hypothetical protein